MAFVEIYSKRQKKLRGEFPDVYQYESIPEKLRVQIVHILIDAFGQPYYDEQWGYWKYNGFSEAYQFIHTTMCR